MQHPWLHCVEQLSASITKHALMKIRKLYQISKLALNILPLSLHSLFFCCSVFLESRNRTSGFNFSLIIYLLYEKRDYSITSCTQNAEVKTKDTMIPKWIPHKWKPISSINIHLSQPNSKIARNRRKAWNCWRLHRWRKFSVGLRCRSVKR